MSGAQVRELTLRIYREIFEGGNLDVANELIASDCVDISPRLPAGLDRRGSEPIKYEVSLLHDAFPDLNIRVREVLVDGESAVCRMTFEGLHEGSMKDMSPTGKWIAWDALDVLKFRGGMVRERYSLWDEAGLVHQMKTKDAAWAL